MKQQHPIDKIDFGLIGIVNYRGCKLEKVIGGFRILNKLVVHPYEVDQVIEQSYQSLEKSIKQKL